MKLIGLLLACGTLTFLAAGYHMGLFEQATADGEAPIVQTVEDTPAAIFPDDLSAAVQGKPVPQASAYQPGAEPHPLVFFQSDGKLHDWQEQLPQTWQPDSVASTEIVVVVGEKAVTRSARDLDLRVIEARTGKVLGSRSFPAVSRQNTLRTVSFTTVLNWVTTQAQSGFTNAPVRGQKKTAARTGAAAPAPTSDSAVHLTGSQWTGAEDLKDYDRLRFSFVSSSKVIMYDAQEIVHGTWRRSGASITMRFFDDSVVYEGRVYNDSMSGTASNGDATWSWRTTRDSR